MNKNQWTFILLGLLLVLPVSATLESDLKEQSLELRYANEENDILRVGYDLPPTADTDTMIATGFVVMAFAFKNYPTVPTYEIYQYAGDIPVQKLTVRNIDVDNVLFGKMTNTQFWNSVRVELFPKEPATGNVLLGFIIIFGFLGLVGYGIYYLIKSGKTKGKR